MGAWKGKKTYWGSALGKATQMYAQQGQGFHRHHQELPFTHLLALLTQVLKSYFLPTSSPKLEVQAEQSSVLTPQVQKSKE